MSRQSINDALKLIFDGITRLQENFPHRLFTIDGRLVGDIGEVIAEIEYHVALNQTSLPGYDAVTPDGRKVQIKATFKESLTFTTITDLYLGFKLYRDGRHEEVFNGPAKIIYDRYASRKGIGTKLLSFPIAKLRQLSTPIPEQQRVPRRQLDANPDVTTDL